MLLIGGQRRGACPALVGCRRRGVTTTLQILIVDDHALFREAMADILSRLDSRPTVLEAGTANEALNVLSHYRNLDMILLDHTMPGLNGVDAIPTLHEKSPQTPIVVVSANDDAATVHAAIAVGASGYVPKSANSHVLLNALKVVLAGEIYLPPRYLAPDSAADSAAPASGLTQRQLEVLALLADGLPNKSIGRQLGIAEATVKLHVSAILRELGARNRTEAVVAATDRGLL